MSDATKAALDRAVAEHFASTQEDEGGVCTGYIMQACGVGNDPDTSLFVRTQLDGQTIVTSLGLVTWLDAWAAGEATPDA